MMNFKDYSFPSPSGGLILSSSKSANGNEAGATAQLLYVDPKLLPNQRAADYSLGLHDFQKSPGVFTPDTGHFLPIKIDDATAIAMGPSTALAMYQFGSFTWIPRIFIYIQGFWPYLKFSAGKRVWPFGRFVWAVSVILSANQPITRQDSWCQTAMQILVKRRRGWSSWTGELAIRYWKWRKGPITMDKIYAAYCKDVDHPLVYAWKNAEDELNG